MSNSRFGLRTRKGEVSAFIQGLTPIDPNAEEFLSATGITDLTITTGINTLVIDLKTFGIWSKMKAIYPFVGGTATTHKYNLKDPQDTNAAFRLVFSGGWTHSANGALPNGTNAFADTFFNPSELSQDVNSSHLSFYQRGFSTSGTSRVKIGAATDSSNAANGFALGFLLIGTRETGIVGSSSQSEYTPSTANASSQGLLMINTNGNRNAQYWKDGNKIGSEVTQSGSMPNVNIHIGKLNKSTGAFDGFNNTQSAFISIGDGLTDTEVADLYTAVQAFQTTLNRQV